MPGIEDIGGIIGEPVPNMFINGLLSAFNFFSQQGSRPEAPQPFTRNAGGGRGTDVGGPNAGGPAQPANIRLGDYMATAMGDERRAFAAQNRYNERLRGGVDRFRDVTREGAAGFDRASRDVTAATNYGEAGYDRARGEIANAKLSATKNATRSIASLRAMVEGVKTYVGQAVATVSQLRGDTLAQYKNQAAQQLQDVALGLGQQAGDAASDVMAGARAAGIPEAQVQSMGYQTLMKGKETLANTSVQIASAESKRFTEMLVTTGGWITGIVQMGTQMTATTMMTAGKGAAEVMSGLTSFRGEMAKESAALEESAANWRGSMSSVQAQLASQKAQLLLGGAEGEAGLLSLMEEPFIRMGDILGEVFTLNLGLEDLQHRYDMEYYTGQVISTDQLIQSLSGQFMHQQELNESRHQQGVAQNQATQDRTTEIGLEGAKALATAFAGSDRRLKKGIVDTKQVGAFGLPIYTFEYRQDVHPSMKLPSGPQVGHMADEVVKQCPEAVAADDFGYLMVDYGLLYRKSLSQTAEKGT